MLADRRHAVVRGSCCLVLPISRRSWECEWKWINLPAQINSRALNIAWVIRWKKAKFVKFREILVIITPSCLRVESAIIFFISVSTIAFIPAISIVRDDRISRVMVAHLFGIRFGLNRIRRKIPAVTKVDEWTSAETGVGAAIAEGSHLENGIWALFVMAAIIISQVTNTSILWCILLIISQWPLFLLIPMAVRINTSPIRLVRAVIIPAARDLGFW
jgi:hypothetical protein